MWPDGTTPRLPSPRATAAVAVVGLGALAWVALLAWDASNHARYLDHDTIADGGLSGGALLAVFLAGWTLMVLAMMLPSTYPVVRTFTAVVRARGDRRRLVASLLAGYLATWVAVGCIALSADTALHAVENAVPALGRHPWVLGAGALALAAAFQFSDLKYRCLDRCRNPRMVVMAAWHGRRPVLEAARLGWDHGRSCVGCCWALMLVMFGVGAGNLGWMFLLGVVMTLEKVGPLDRRFARGVGVALAVGAGVTVLVHGAQVLGASPPA